jgi:signal transduction histidine kinase
MRKPYLFLYFSCFCWSIVAQSPNNDAIQALLKNAMEQSDVDINQALYFANTALQKADNEQNTFMIYESYRKLGAIMEDNNRLSEAKDFYAQALTISEKKEVPADRKLDILNEWAIINKKMGQYKIAQDFHLKSIEEAKKIDDQEMVEFGYHGIGSMYSMMSDFEKAVQYYILSMKAAEASGNKEGATITQQNIASIYLKAKNIDMAYSSAEKALKMATELNDSSRIAKVLRVFADIELAKGNPVEALKKNQISYQIFEKKGDKRNLGETFLSIASNYYEQKQYEKAEDYFYQCKILLPYLMPYGNANYYNKLGKLYVVKNETSEAIKSFEKSLVLTDSLGFKEIAAANHSALAEIFAVQKNFEKAHYHSTLSAKINTQLFEENRKKEFTEAQFKYDVAQNDKEIQSLKEQKLKSYAWFVFALIGLLAFFSIYNLRKNKQLKQKNEAINLQNKRLEAHNNSLLQVAYVAAHDLKEPLRSIGSFTNLLQRKYGSQFNGEAQEYMTYVVNSAQKLNELFTGLLAYSSIVADDDIADETCDFNIVVAEVLHYYSDGIKATKAAVNYDIDMPTLPMKYNHGLELVKNLVCNSLKFSGENPIICIASKKLPDNRTEISVKDNGKGIGNIQKGKIFNLFHREDRSEKNQGVGVGLAICKAIAEKYSGSINFESNEKGTVFKVILGEEVQ